MRTTGLAVLTLTIIGIVAGIFMGGFADLWRMGRSSDWPWWAYALAIPVLGLGVVVFVGALDALFIPFTWKESESLWKRIAFYFLGATVAGALLLGPLWLSLASR